MAGVWDVIDDLPAVYGGLAAGVRETNRDLARHGLTKVGRRDPGNAMYLLSAVRAKTLVYLASESQRLVFWFPVGRPEKDVVLRLDLSFMVAPVWADRPEGSKPWDNVKTQALVPEFLGAGVDFSQRAKLAAELSEDHWEKILFLHVGLFRMAVIRADDWAEAQVSWMWHGDPEARTVYRRIPSNDALTTVKFEPEPFFMLMREVDTWVRSDFKKGVWVEGSLPSLDDPKPVRRIAATAVQAWRQAARETIGEPTDIRPLTDSFLPESAIHHFQADVTLRLTTKGTLAEKKSDDNFRLRLSLEINEEGEAARAAMRVGPADFLVSGVLYHKLLEVIRGDEAIERLFEDAGLKSFERVAFGSFLRGDATVVSAFRVDKDNDIDTEIFLFRGPWNGKTGILAASAKFRVRREGDEFEVTPHGGGDSTMVVYSNLSTPTKAEPLFPRYLLSLVNQLGHMRRSLL